MRQRVCHLASFNGLPTLWSVKYGAVLALFVFTTCISLARQADNYRVFDEEYRALDYGHKLHNSTFSAVTDDVIKEQKRRLPNSESKNGMSNYIEMEKIKRSANGKTNAGDHGSPEENGNAISNRSSASPPGSTPEKYHFRIFITLLKPYTKELSSKSGREFLDMAAQINLAIRSLLGAPDFVKSNVVGITSTNLTAASKAIVDLEASESITNEDIEDKIFVYLDSKHKLGNIPSTSDRLLVKNYRDKQPTTCDGDELPCPGTEDYCYPPSGRCDGFPRCPDRSDELDCPGKNDADVPQIEDKCRSQDKKFCPLGGRIICESDFCNNVTDCPKGEDENENEKCPKSSPNPSAPNPDESFPFGRFLVLFSICAVVVGLYCFFRKNKNTLVNTFKFR